MKYHILLVDDDQRIRAGLARHIDWLGLGYETPVLAANAAQAWQALRTEKIDVLVTDIRLPGESGLEFCRCLRAQYPEMPIFILSAFSDFDYAQQAIRLGVKRYFTKPTDLQAFSEAMAAARDELEQRQRTRERQSAREKRYTRAYRFLLSRLWADLAGGVIREDADLHAFFEENHIKLPYPMFVLLRVQSAADALVAEQSRLRDALEESGCLVHHFSRTGESICFLVNTPDESTVEYVLEEFLRRISPQTRLSVSNFVPALSRLPECMEQLRRAEDGTGQLRRAAALPCAADASAGIKSSLETALMEAVDAVDEAQAERVLDQLYRAYAELSPDARCDLFVQLLARLQRHAGRYGIDPSQLYSADFSASRMAQRLAAPAQMDAWLREHVRRILALHRQNQDAYSAQIINEVRAYIAAHYAEDISLVRVAEVVHLSPYYVSKMFKRVTGEKFIDHLTAVRMERAMELLALRDSRIYEVAGQVGYKSTKHFSQVFKAHTGKTPLCYKKGVCRGDGGIG